MKRDWGFKRDARFNLRMTQEEMDELLKWAGEGYCSDFIRKAIKAAIEKKVKAVTKKTK